MKSQESDATAPGAAPGGEPAIPVEARELLPGCVHLAFRDGRGVALHRATGEFVIYTCVESGRGLAGNYYRPERLLDRRRDHLEAAGAAWLVPWLQRLKAGEPASTDELLDHYRERYGNDPVAS